MPSTYVFLDPFNQVTSGVTSYIKLAAARMQALGWTTKIIARQVEETLTSFRIRALKEALQVYPVICVEAPETLAATKLLPTTIPVHIRLHCSKALGAALQGLNYSKVDVVDEQREISRARWVSAPSQTVVIATKILFHLPLEVAVFANPAPRYKPCPEALRRRNVLFIGRWQHLKGIHFLIELAKQMPDCGFNAIIPVETKGLPRNITIIRPRDFDSNWRAIAQAKLVIVPSLFESASMVGLESLAVGTPVVTWEHLGLTEYATNPHIHAIKSWDIEEMGSAIARILSEPLPKDFPIVLDRINKGFDRGVDQLIHNKPIEQSSGLICGAHKNLEKILANLIESERRKKSKGIFFRRVRKLFRDPKSYWRDSKFRTIFISPGKALSVPSLEMKNGQALSNLNFQQPIDPTVSLNGELILGHIPSNGKINFKDVEKNRRSSRTAIFYPNDFINGANKFLNSLDQHKDFSPILAGSRYVGMFDIDKNEPILSILNRIDLRNKERISSFDNLVFLDAPINLITALRSCSDRVRTFLLLTENAPVEYPMDTAVIDVLITPASHSAAKAAGYRRKIIIDGTHDFHIAIRRAIQEGAPKIPDQLLPLINAKAYQPDLLDFDPTRFQGIIRLNKIVSTPVNSFREFVEQTAMHVESMFVLESVYLRYRSMCEGIERGASPAQLIEACLHDGVLFHVES